MPIIFGVTRHKRPSAMSSFGRLSSTNCVRGGPALVDRNGPPALAVKLGDFDRKRNLDEVRCHFVDRNLSLTSLRKEKHKKLEECEVQAWLLKCQIIFEAAAHPPFQT
jgi:hypothetical protein